MGFHTLCLVCWKDSRGCCLLQTLQEAAQALFALLLGVLS